MRCLLLLLTLLGFSAEAHEVRPAYLELHEAANGEVAVLWKTPMRGDMRLSLWPELSGSQMPLTDVASLQTGGAAVQRWRLRAEAPLRGQTLRIAGLESTMTDVLVRATFADGTSWTQRLTPAQPEVLVPAQESALSVAWLYLKLGVEHILAGIDHLLFVLALMLITRGRMLVKTVTAFTVAHSITLALAALGLVHVPQAPVEAVIALSIVFVAAEILRARKARGGLATRAPWMVAFIFGLMHGFGFAGALSELGLPQAQIPAALLFFNIGVEVGQLLFIGAVICIIAGLRRLRFTVPSWGEAIVPYAIGIMAMFWVFERTLSF
ncbi:MAG: HupE/UreJ family protein [Moraxellaceae bacterium]|nr:HupE/UreJ family protein [Moraxellaceae bacterium]